VHAPEIFDLEVVSALRRFLRRGSIEAGAADAACDGLARMAVFRHPHEPLLPRVWELREHFTPYDAAYIALAEALDAPLLTLDAGLADSPGHGARVEVLD
jgi:predicted nucleic acid-binding protein